MIDIHRKAPRFTFSFSLESNTLSGYGDNISQKGIGFHTDNELIPAYDIPFSITLKHESGENCTINGRGSILYSEKSTSGTTYYNGFEFLLLNEESRQNLFTFIRNRLEVSGKIDAPDKDKNLDTYFLFPDESILKKANLFGESREKLISGHYRTESLSILERNGEHATFSGSQHTNMTMLDFGSGDFLSISSHPDVIHSSTEALSSRGFTFSLLPRGGGTPGYIQEIEDEIAEYCGYEAAMLTHTGYIALTSLVEGLSRPKDAVIVNEGSERGFIDGALLSDSRMYYFEKFSPGGLERILKRSSELYKGKLVIINQVDQFTGETACYDLFASIKEQIPFTDILDLSYSEDIRLTPESIHTPDLITGSFISFGLDGGFAAGSKDAISYCKMYSKVYNYNPVISPCHAASIRAVIRLLKDDISYIEAYRAKRSLFTQLLTDLGITIINPESTILSVNVKDPDIIEKVSNELYAENLYHSLILYPHVPMGGNLLRFTVSRHHTDEAIVRASELIHRTLRKYSKNSTGTL